MVNQKKRFNIKYSLVIITLILFIYILSTMHFSFVMDEEFSMGIIRHNIYQIINIDSLDVHPPLYYILLKLFVFMCTFWTKSLFIKILAARMFSIIGFVLSFYFLSRIFAIIGFHINTKLQLIFYLFIPSILNYSTMIRMYSLASLFLILELYSIILFNNKLEYKYILFAILFGSLAAYTHYFAAVSAGLFLFIFFILFAIKKNFVKSLMYFISGIVFLILYVPLFSFIFKQFKYETNGKSYQSGNSLFHEVYSSFTGLGYSYGIIRMIIVSMVLGLFILLIVWSFLSLSYKFRLYFAVALFNFILTIFVAICSHAIKGTPFTSRFIYPIFSIFSFFLVYAFIKYIFYLNINKLMKIGVIVWSLIFIAISFNYIHKNIIDYDVTSISLVKNYDQWSNNKNKFIDINPKFDPKTNSLYITQSSLYLATLHKKERVNSKEYNPNVVRDSLFGHDNKKLFMKLFNNIKFY